MQPWDIIERTTAPGGTELVLARRGDEWVVRAGGRVLMSSRAHGSEEALAVLALERLARGQRHAPTVLLGGLGLGFTLRALLDGLGPDARVVVAELVPALVAWNRGPVAHLARRPLEDGRVRLQVRDAATCIGEAERAFDAVILDLDNGPAALVRRDNGDLYGDAGVASCHRALRAGGVLAVWSAGPDARFLERLERAGFAAEQRLVASRAGGGVRHAILIGEKDRAPVGSRGKGQPRPGEGSPAGTPGRLGARRPGGSSAPGRSTVSRRGRR